jgi:hypothetical protein
MNIKTRDNSSGEKWNSEVLCIQLCTIRLSNEIYQPSHRILIQNMQYSWQKYRFQDVPERPKPHATRNNWTANRPKVSQHSPRHHLRRINEHDLRQTASAASNATYTAEYHDDEEIGLWQRIKRGAAKFFRRFACTAGDEETCSPSLCSRMPWRKNRADQKPHQIQRADEGEISQ